LVVGSGDARDASIIDVTSATKVATVPLGGTAESMAVDGGAGRVFINVDTANEIARLDLHTNKIDARWPTPGCEAPHGLAIDNVKGRLFASCRNAKMIVLDARTGKSLALLRIGVGTDSAAFDPKRLRAFSANKDGTLSIVTERPGGTFVSHPGVPTAPGAKNMAVDPRTGRIFLVTASVATSRPAQKPGGSPSYDFASGTVKVMIFDPKP
ncbi:MAG: hypothetical protein JOZ79_13970, partial [Sphingomonas sp.]|nr:hypothetical protein [Sphingomonas sp.]